MHREDTWQEETSPALPEKAPKEQVSSIYFNKARSPVTVTLRTGEASLVRPKGRLVVTVEQDGSPSLFAMVRKGVLQREKVVASGVPAAPSQVSLSVSPIASIAPDLSLKLFSVVERLEVPPNREDVSREEPSEKPSAEWSKSKLAAFARDAGIVVEARWSKAALLRAIEEAGS
jgi:hypothetical protein